MPRPTPDLTAVRLRTLKAPVLWAPLLAVVLGGCERAEVDPRGVTVTRLPDGVVGVANTGDGAWSEATAWRAVEVLRIGRGDGDGADVFAAPLSMETDSDGNLYVLDLMAMQVRAFAPDGRHLRTFGRSGAGPGELRQPVAITRGPEASLWIYDPGNARFTVFDTNGELREIHARNNPTDFNPWPGRIDDSGRLWDAGSAGSPGAPPLLLWTEISGDGSGQATLPDFRPEQFTGSAGPTSFSAPVPFSPQLHWSLDPGGRVWAGVSDRYRLVHFVPGGDTLRVVELDQQPMAVAAAERAAAVEDLSWFTDQGGRIDGSRIPNRKPAFTDMRTDDRGWLWVTPSLPADASRSAFDVFDPEGVYHGRLELPILLEPWSPIIVRGDRLYTAVLAEAGHPQVVVFRLEGRDAP